MISDSDFLIDELEYQVYMPDSLSVMLRKYASSLIFQKFIISCSFNCHFKFKKTALFFELKKNESTT